MTQPAPGSRAARAAETARVLKEAGRRVFARHGFLDAKITDIATDAGRSVGSFYKHFASKEELLHALLLDWTASAGRQLRTDPAGDDLADPAALRTRVAAYVQTYREHLPEIRALGEAAMVDPVFAARLAATRHQQLASLRDHLERMQDRNLVLSGDPAVLAVAFSALLEGFCAIWMADEQQPFDRTVTDTEVIDTLTSLLQHGLARLPE